jgi:hypothetical protein
MAPPSSQPGSPRAGAVDLSNGPSEHAAKRGAPNVKMVVFQSRNGQLASGGAHPAYQSCSWNFHPATCLNV